jgi:lysine biosynthesis protein LysW
MPFAVCPECEAEIVIETKPTVGQLVSCPHCTAGLEVVNLSPLELDWAFVEGEDDWENDALDDDEDEDDLDDEEEDWDDEEEEEDWEEEEADSF